MPWATALAACISLAATVVSFFVPYMDRVIAGLFGLVEAAGLLVLLAMVVRTTPRGLVVGLGVLLTLAYLVWLLRIPAPPSVGAGLATLLVWFAGPVTALIAGGYPRLAEACRQRSVEDARQAQRLHLARDLHDFVAHDVTGLVVQAQAAQHVGRADPAAALEALRRIESAGLHALASMDQALEILRDGDSPVGPQARSSEQVAPLLESFSAAGGPAVEAQIDSAVWHRLSPEENAVIYRVLVEAPTNVRRHAPNTPFVQVSLAGPPVRVIVGRAAAALRAALDSDPGEQCS